MVQQKLHSGISTSEELDGLLKHNGKLHKNYKMYTSMEQAMSFLLSGNLYLTNGSNWNDKDDRELMKIRNTFFMRELIDDAQHLQAKAQTAESKAAAKKIYDAIRYSDLTSDEAFAQEERAIMKQISELGVLMDNGATGETIESKTGELLRLIEERNQKCMSNKRTRV